MSEESDAKLRAEQSRAEADWLFSQNLVGFSGQWVAVFGRKILAHGRELKRVHADAAKKLGANQVALFYCVPSGIAGGA